MEIASQNEGEIDWGKVASEESKYTKNKSALGINQISPPVRTYRHSPLHTNFL